MTLFPMFVRLDGRPVLLVGAGRIGESKVSGLLAAGASVTVVAPSATPAIAKLAEEGQLHWRQREFLPNDLDGVTLVVAAVPKEVATTIYEEAQIRGVLCNSVDDIENCDFYYPAVVNRGDLQIAISTGGQSPALAQRLRIQLEQQFGPEYAEWIQQLGATRRELFSADMDPEARKRKLHEMARPGPEAPAPPGIGHVYLVGAGPGDPELLTLKALRLLGQADVVLHDDLLTPDILELIPPAARVESVGKRHGERQITQQEINRRLCDYGAAGKIVVRLKGGDGAVFGRASEEMEALRAAEVEFSIVPGVTAASAAAAAAGVSLTDRRLGSALVFLTAQRCKGNPPPNWKAVAQLGGAAAIYMPGGHEAELARQLVDAGMPQETPCFIVASATRTDEQVVETTLGEVPALRQLPAPAILLVGVLPSKQAQVPATLEKARKHAANH
jgi:uroporphyrin-III C-methyltransferase/precorrin-2 dehydrogenase/sirohydrochlorin ferrochelatase